MKTLIKLTDHNGATIILNMRYVAVIYEDDEGSRCYDVSRGRFIFVKETPNEIYNQMEA